MKRNQSFEAITEEGSAELNTDLSHMQIGVEYPAAAGPVSGVSEA